MQQPHQDNNYCTSYTNKQIYNNLTKTIITVLHKQIDKYATTLPRQ